MRPAPNHDFDGMLWALVGVAVLAFVVLAILALTIPRH
jgi:hypothetical protein